MMLVSFTFREQSRVVRTALLAPAAVTSSLGDGRNLPTLPEFSVISVTKNFATSTSCVLTS